MSAERRHALRLAGLLALLAVAGAALTLAVVSTRDDAARASAAGAPAAAVVVAETPTVTSTAPRVARRLHVPRRAHAARRRASERAIALPHASRAIGRPSDGRLEGGVVLPAAGRDFFTWTLATGETPSPDWRRVGTDTLVSWLQGVLRYFRATHPGAPRIGISDLSLPQGGPFGPGYGGLGHASHQNGLDVDVLYPRRDRAERAAARPGEVDRVLSQQLVDTFVAAGAQFCFVGQHLGLGGPAAVVQAIPHHDDHVHVRIAPLG